MLYWVFTIFVLLHGLVHMVYTAMARNWIPAPQGQENWTGSSWLLAGQLGEQGTRNVGVVGFTLVTVLFGITAIGMMLRSPWATAWLAGSAILSSIFLLLMWDGKFQSLTEKGFIGLAINVALLILLFAFQFPKI
ncbi:MAG: hypothetical protein WEC37_03345 [Anaerolineales bacterium]